MTFVSSICLYCPNERTVTAEKSQWLVHLSQHREEIIKQLTDTSSSCVFCAYPVEFANKKHASSHYRWGHKKNSLVEWSLNQLQVKILA